MRAVGRSEIPSTFWEPYIHSGYRRPDGSIQSYFRSAFGRHNEVMNFWTHFLPAFYFVFLFSQYLMDPLRLHDSYSWPYFASLLTCAAFMLSSAFAHLLCSRSTKALHICFMFDYMSISWYSCGAAVAYQAYSLNPVFQKWGFLEQVYLPICATAGVLSTLFACRTRHATFSKKVKAFRLISLALSYISVNTPLLMRLQMEFSKPELDSMDPVVWIHTRQFVFIFLSISFYASHFPECIWPGKFDNFGHSHQIFHMFGVLGSYHQVHAVYQDMKLGHHLGDKRGILDNKQCSYYMTIFFVAIVANALVVAMNVARLYGKRLHVPTKALDATIGRLKLALEKRKYKFG